MSRRGFLGALLGALGCGSARAPLPDTDEGLRAWALGVAPVGSKLADARTAFEAAGFQCTLLPAGTRPDGTTTPPALHCDRRDRTRPLVARRAQLVISYGADDRVTAVEATTALVGP